MIKYSAERMDRQEGSYSKKWAILYAYDGRQLNGYAYIIYKEPGSEELNPSSRYLELLVKGSIGLGPNHLYTSLMADFHQDIINKDFSQLYDY